MARSDGREAAFIDQHHELRPAIARWWRKRGDQIRPSIPIQIREGKHLQQQQEAKERDHRITGRKLQLFLTDDEVGQGLILWPPAGTIVRDQLQLCIQEELSKRGYAMVHTPHIGRLGLYRTSGHFPYYRDSQYPPMVDPETLGRFASEGRTCGELANRLAGDGEPIDGYLLKPMNCPHHIKIFASVPRSYRELPVRLGEFGTVYRWEQSGEIGGLTRVRGFTQDDAHLFCMESQVGDELRGCLDLVGLVFGQLGMNDYRVRVGLRDPNSSKYVGTPDQWTKAERDCKEAAAALQVPFSEEPGEAAFYGPKIDFVVSDILGREWQLGTVQCDYNLPQRFELSYVGPDNRRHVPVMIHRAPFGSLERFVGVLIEHFNGAFPTWLSPEQARILTVSDSCRDYGEVVLRAFQDAGIRATLDASSERLPAKIRAASEMKIPYLLVVGPRDQASGAVSVRVRDLQRDIGQMQLGDVVARIRDEVQARRLQSFAAERGK